MVSRDMHKIKEKRSHYFPYHMNEFAIFNFSFINYDNPVYLYEY